MEKEKEEQIRAKQKQKLKITKKQCKFIDTYKGCKKGSQCNFSHD